MSLVIKLISSPWFWVDVLVSITGVFLVFWGLWLEKKAEQRLPPSDFRPDIYGDVVEQQKAQLERGWRILMAGIVVEGIAALGISMISGLEIAQLNDKAAKANERATTNELRVAQLEQETARLVTIGERAKESAALATEEAEKAKAEREKAEAGRLALEVEVLQLKSIAKPREITPEQRNTFVSFLCSETNKEAVLVVSISSSGNARHLAGQVRKMLDDAGFGMADKSIGDFGRFAGFSGGGIMETSIALNFNKPESDPWVIVAFSPSGEHPHAGSLQRAFSLSGINVEFMTLENLKPGKVAIIVPGKRGF